jgi:hypothetical protein
MTPNQLAKLINSLQYRKRMSLAIGDLESEVITFLTTKGCLDRPVVIQGWEVFFDGQELFISEAPFENLEQMDLFERR